MKNNILRRVLITVITGAVIATSVPQVAYASPQSATETSVDNEQVAKDALQVLEKAIASNDAGEIAKAYKLITSLTPTQRVHLFILKYGKLYLEGCMRGSFAYFDAAKYLAENPEVYSQAISNGTNPSEYAVNHYLSTGIFEGKSSGTSFDPIVAILACPDATVNALISNDDSSLKIFTDLNDAFTNETGDADTRDYSIGALFLFDSAANQIVDNSKTNRLSVSKIVTPPVVNDVTQTGNNDNNDSDDGHSSSSDKPKPIPTPDPHPTPDPTIVERSQTMLLYLCGSDLETADNPNASDVIKELLAADFDPETTKILVMAGGAKDWYTEPFSSDLGGTNAGKICIYELDISSLEGKLIDDDTDIKDVVNSNTVKKVATYVKDYSMADAETLTSFVDFATCKSEYAADDYSLILWGHGDGFMGGVCYDANYRDSQGNMRSLDCNDLQKAISNTKYCIGGNKLAFLGFDACLMGGYENAVTLAPYYEYMVGTAEIEQGSWNYTKLMEALDRYASGEYSAEFPDDEQKDQKAKYQMLADIVKDLGQTHGDVTEGFMPYSCYDGSKLDPTNPASLAYHIDNISKNIKDALGEKGDRDVKFYRALMAARSLSRTYGDDTTRNTDCDYTDLGELIFNIENQVGQLINSNPGSADKYEAVLNAIEGFEECLEQYGNFIDYSSCMVSDKTIYGGFAADGQYYTFDSIDADRYKDRNSDTNPYFVNFWREMGFSTDFLGTSVYFPHNSNRTAADIKNKYGSLTDKTKSKTGLAEYRAMLESVISIYGEDLYAKSTGEKYNEQDRIKFLQGYIYNEQSGSYKQNADLNTNAKKLFAKIFDTEHADIKTTADGVRYIHIPVKDSASYSEKVTTTQEGGYSTGDAAVDLSDTIGKITVYTMRHLNLKDSADADIYDGDIIYCAGDEKLSALNRSDGSLNIILDTEDENHNSNVSKSSVMRSQYYYGASGTYANNKNEYVRDVAVGRRTISYDNLDERTTFTRLAGELISNVAEEIIEVGSLFYFTGRVVIGALQSASEGSTEYQDANLYFTKTGVDNDGFDVLKFVGSSGLDKQSNVRSVKDNEISSFQFYHYTIDENTGTVYAIEKGLTKDNEMVIEGKDLGINFLVSEGTGDQAQTYAVTITEKLINYGDELSSNKYAVGVESEAEIASGDKPEGIDEWLDADGNPIDRYMIVGDKLTVSDAEYETSNQDIGVFESAPSADPEDGEDDDKYEGRAIMMADNDADEDFLLVEDEIAQADNTPAADVVPAVIISKISDIKVPGVITPGQIIDHPAESSDDSGEACESGDSAITDIPAQTVDIGEYIVPETSIPFESSNTENNTPPTPDADCGNDSSGSDDSISSDTGSSDSGSDDGDSASDSEAGSEEA